MDSLNHEPKKLTTAAVAMAVTGAIVIYRLKPPTNEREAETETETETGIGSGDSAQASDVPQPKPQPERDPTDMTVRFDEIAPGFDNKPIPDLATWRCNSRHYPPMGKHREKLVRC